MSVAYICDFVSSGVLLLGLFLMIPVWTDFQLRLGKSEVSPFNLSGSSCESDNWRKMHGCFWQNLSVPNNAVCPSNACHTKYYISLTANKNVWHIWNMPHLKSVQSCYNILLIYIGSCIAMVLGQSLRKGMLSKQLHKFCGLSVIVMEGRICQTN